jgi:hypothetical protein
VQEHQGQTDDHPLSGHYIKKELRFMMECPHCHQEIPGKPCSRCGVLVPEESRYCMDCGARFEEEEVAQESMDQGDPYDLENRVLCPDGTCTGIISDGRCSECGRSLQEIKAAEEEKTE